MAAVPPLEIDNELLALFIYVYSGDIADPCGNDTDAPEARTGKGTENISRTQIAIEMSFLFDM